MKYILPITIFIAVSLSCQTSIEIPTTETPSRSKAEIFDSLHIAIEQDISIRMKEDSSNDGLSAISIENQIWMKYNLAIDTFSNGDQIIQVNSTEEWKNACDSNTPAWCYMSNSDKYNKTFGKLYNIAAIMDTRGLAPSGWRIPTSNDWQTLIETCSNPVCDLKSNSGWLESSISNCTTRQKLSKFQAYPSGMRMAPGIFGGPFEHAYFWTLDKHGSLSSFNLTGRIAKISIIYSIKYAGISIRYIHK
jgi:uncharacterized protein (TIGR02145 family)